MRGGKTTSKPQNPLRAIVGTDPNFAFTSTFDQMMSKPITLQTAINPPMPQITPRPQITVRPQPAPSIPMTVNPPVTRGGAKREEIKQEVLPEKQEQQELLGEDTKKNLRDAGIIFAGALSSLGAGIAGRDQSAAAQQMFANLDAAARNDLDKKLSDPNSEESKRARELANEKYEGKIKVNPKMSAKELTEMSPYFERLYTRKLQEQMARAKAGQAPAPKIGNMKEVTATKTAKESVLKDIAELRKIVDKYGTFELSGPAEDTKKRLIRQIAVNYNKMLDPNSVVRDEEAKAIESTLGVSGLLTSNKTAIQNLRNFEKQVRDESNLRLQNLTSQNQDEEALKWAMSNPQDPRSAQIMQMFGGR